MMLPAGAGTTKPVQADDIGMSSWLNQHRYSCLSPDVALASVSYILRW